MTPYYEHAGITIYHGDCREILPVLKADCVVTDPPYGMGKAEWDMAIVPVDSWLSLARSIGPVLLFSGIVGMRDYPPADYLGQTIDYPRAWRLSLETRTLLLWVGKGAPSEMVWRSGTDNSLGSWQGK